MWADFNYNNRPNIIVKFSENIENEEDFNMFLKNWMEFYKNKENFNLVFDTTNVGLVDMNYVFKMKKFIKNLKRFENQYLQWSIIIVSNKFIKYLLNMVFMVQKPVAKVYIYNVPDSNKIEYKTLIDDVKNNNLNKFLIINP